MKSGGHSHLCPAQFAGGSFFDHRIFLHEQPDHEGGNNTQEPKANNHSNADGSSDSRTGLFPPHHIVGVRREVFEKNPWVLRSLYHALDQSKNRWQASRRRLNDTTPWLLAEIEETTALMGEDWFPYGVQPNRKVVEALCQEQFAQKLVPQPVDPATVFAEFEEVMED